LELPNVTFVCPKGGCYNINPNCPKLISAFYEFSDNNLHQYLHQVLGISIYAHDEMGDTAFYLAPQTKNLEALGRLLKVVPNGITMRNNAGKTSEDLLQEPTINPSLSRKAEFNLPGRCLWGYLRFRANTPRSRSRQLMYLILGRPTEHVRFYDGSLEIKYDI
jgi:hypothetical protein